MVERDGIRLSRRALLTGLSSTVFFNSLPKFFENFPELENDLKKKIGGNEKFSKDFFLNLKQEHKKVVIETLIMFIGNQISKEIFNNSALSENLNLKFGNAQVSEQLSELKKRELGMVFATKFTISDPVLEEFLFRLVPDVILQELGSKGTIAMHIGVPVSFVFALLHRVEAKNEEKKYFHMTAFVMGLYWWYLNRKYGIALPIVSHALYNSILLVSGKLDKMLG